MSNTENLNSKPINHTTHTNQQNNSNYNHPTHRQEPLPLNQIELIDTANSNNSMNDTVHDMYAAVTTKGKSKATADAKPYSIENAPKRRTRSTTANKIEKPTKTSDTKKAVKFIHQTQSNPGVQVVDNTSIPTNITIDTSHLTPNGSFTPVPEPMDEDDEMTLAPQISSSKTPPTRRRRANSVPNITYNVVDDLFNSKTTIDVRDLFIAAPNIKRDFMAACRALPRLKPSTKTRVNDLVSSVNVENEVPLNFIEDGDIDTTAMHATVYINNQPIPSIIDSGSAKTCISKDMADRLGLSIDSPTTSVFRMGNGSVQPALGIIYDAPINPGGKLIIPGSVEVLPTCPGNLIIGNNWLHRAKSLIDYEHRTVTVKYKKNRATFPVVYDKAEVMRHFKIRSVAKQHYDVEINNSSSRKANHNKIIQEANGNYSDEYEEDSTTDEEHYENDDMPQDSDEDSQDSQDMFYMDDLYYLENDITPLSNTIAGHPDDDDPSTMQIFTTSRLTIAPYATASLNITGHLLSQFPDHDTNSRYMFTMLNPTLSDYGVSHMLDDKHTIQLTNPTSENLILETNIFLGEAELCDDSTIESCFLFEIDDAKVHELFNMDTTNTNTTHTTNTQNETDNDDVELSPELQEKLDLSTVPSSVKSDLLKLLHKFRNIFDWYNDRIGRINVAEYQIKLKPDAIPFKATPYRLSPLETQSLKEEIDKLLRLGVIKEYAYSDWAAPIMMVKKKDGSYRLVVDLRKCNNQIVRTMHPIPRIDDLIDILGRSKTFSQFDLRSSFFQVPLAEESQPIASFITKLGHFMFCRLPQGLSSSPNFFMYVMELCFKPLINKILVIYLDDLTSFSDEDPQNHLNNLKQIFSCIERCGMLLNPSKTHLFTKQIPFLGVIITAEGVHTDPRLVSKVKDFPVPNTLKALRQFCGLTSYYRRFIQSYAAIARPLYDLLKKENAKFTITKDGIKAFENLKQKLIEAPILLIADFSKPFVIVTDASVVGFGAVLSQKDEKGRDHPIIYSSRSLKDTEKNWGISKLELGAVVWALDLYRPYVLGSQFTVEVLTDNSGAVGLINTKSPKGILARWLQQLSEYTFTIKFRPGRTNGNADFLSRLGY